MGVLLSRAHKYRHILTDRHTDTHHTQIHSTHVDIQTYTHYTYRHTGTHTEHKWNLLIKMTTQEETIGKGNTAVLLSTEKPLVPSLRGKPLELMCPHSSFSDSLKG